LQLLEDAVVEQRIVGSSRISGSTGSFPQANAAFVAGTEDILDVYQRPHDPTCPVVCLDETSKQMINETHGQSPATRSATIMNMPAMAPPTCSCCLPRSRAGAT
jgi:hypothetical protein